MALRYDFNTGKWVEDNVPQQTISIAPRQPVAPLPVIKVAPQPYGPPAPLRVVPLPPQPKLNVVRNTGSQTNTHNPQNPPKSATQQIQPAGKLQLNFNPQGTTNKVNPPTNQRLDLTKLQELKVSGVDGQAPPKYVAPPPPKSFWQKLVETFNEQMDMKQRANQATVEVAGGALQEVFRSGASAGLSLQRPFTGKDTLEIDRNASMFTQVVQEAIFGDQPVKDLASRIAEAELKVEPYLAKDSKNAALPISFAAVIGMTALDFTGIGGGAKTVFKTIAKSDDVAKIAGILTKIGVADDIVIPTAQKMAGITDEKVIQKAIERIDEVQKISKAPRATASASKALPDIQPKKQLSVPPQPGTTLVESVSYKPSLADIPGSVQRERGFMTKLKADPRTAATFDDLESLYDTKPRPEMVDFARNLIDNNVDDARRLANSTEKGAEYTAVRMTLLNDAIAAGDTGTVIKMGNKLAEEGTEIAQGLEAYKMLNGEINTPAKAIVTATRQFQKATKEIAPRLEYQTKKIAQEFEKIHKEAVDRILNEVDELKPPKAALPKLTKGAKPTLQQSIDSKQINPAEILAERIRTARKSPKPRDPVKDMVNTLEKIAKEVMPAKKMRVPRNEIELIGQALRDKELYKEVWLQAQKIVKERYADNPEALKELAKYFDETLLSKELVHARLPVAEKQISKALREELKNQNVNVGKIVREHYTKVDAAGKDLRTKLVELADVPAKEAMHLAAKIDNRFRELVTERKSSILKNIFRDRGAVKKKGFVDEIIELTNLGGFDQAAFKTQMAKKLGLPSLSEELSKKLAAQADLIQKTPEGYQKFKETENLLRMISDEIPQTWGNIGEEVINTPRTLMSSFLDLSFGFRQGLFVASAHPKMFGNAFKGQFKQFALEKKFEEAMDVVMKNPDFKLANKSGVAFTEMGTHIARREERYMSSLAERIPLIGKGVRMTARAYTGMANKLRMDLFHDMVENARLMGRDPELDTVLAEDIAEFINNATGRGSRLSLPMTTLGVNIEGTLGRVLNGLFFSPRLMASRMTLLNPAYYYKLDPMVRKEALKDMMAFAGTTMTALAIADRAGADIELDPRNADFAKIRVGNTRIDIMGGFQQYIRMFAQLATATYIDSSTGKEITLGQGYKPKTYLTIIGKQLESKESPVAGFIHALLKQQDEKGDPVSVPQELLDLVTPMIVGDMIDLYKENPKLLPLGLLSTFGFGVMTYPAPAQIEKLNEIEKSSDPEAAFNALYESDPDLAAKVIEAKIQSTYDSFDWKAKGMGVEDGQRAIALFEEMNKLPSDEAKEAKWNEWVDKKIITDTVSEQLSYIISEAQSGKSAEQIVQEAQGTAPSGDRVQSYTEKAKPLEQMSVENLERLAKGEEPIAKPQSSVNTAAIVQKFPTGAKGGQCVTFLHKLVDFPPIGDYLQQKKNAVNNIGIKKADWIGDVRVGDIVITTENATYGHGFLINEVLGNGLIRVTESNRYGNETVTHDRVISINANTIYGAIRGNLKEQYRGAVPTSSSPAASTQKPFNQQEFVAALSRL